MENNHTAAENAMLQRLPFWGDLTPEQRTVVSAHAVRLTLHTGQEIQSGGAQCLGALYVLSGCLRSYLLSPDGRELTLSRTRQGGTYLLTAACALESISFETHVNAEVASELLLIPSDVFQTIVKENVCVERDAYKLLVEGYADAVTSIERMVFLTLEQRLVSFLLDEMSKANSNSINMTHEQIAVSIGSARGAVTRTLNGLSGKGLLTLSRGGIHLLDKAGMYRLIAQ